MCLYIKNIPQFLTVAQSRPPFFSDRNRVQLCLRCKPIPKDTNSDLGKMDYMEPHHTSHNKYH